MQKQAAPGTCPTCGASTVKDAEVIGGEATGRIIDRCYACQYRESIPWDHNLTHRLPRPGRGGGGKPGRPAKPGGQR